MHNHIVDATFEAEDLAAIHDALQVIEEKLQIAVTLDSRTRNRLGRMGLRNETFSRGVLDVAQNNPSLVPPRIDVAALNRDMILREQILPVLYHLQRLTKLADDTAIAAGADAYDGARGLYQTFKVVAPLAGLGEIMAELGERFAGQRRNRKAPDSDANEPSEP